ncbi:unnamed protein product [Rotaria sp. Silwood2]|nr:unnamed protein product [Rotaria sp. Silwood2]CAF2993849.1 unnamed protein product [Rotaria sp. Silwood2]CAF4189208.1 unnamed protein product [Rotaria sp. Silwood2]CAF4354855.1 unnamed protein product [Rotaria sp. Silwood2]
MPLPHCDAEDANRLLTLISTIVIKTKARASGETHIACAPIAIGTTTKTVKTSSASQSSSSATTPQ